MNRWRYRGAMGLAALAAAAFLALPQPATAQPGGFGGNFTTGMQGALGQMMMNPLAMGSEMQMLMNDVQALEYMLQMLLASLGGAQQSGQFQQPSGFQQPFGSSQQQGGQYGLPSGGFQQSPGMFRQGPMGMGGGGFGQGMLSFGQQAGGGSPGSVNVQLNVSICMQMSGPSSNQSGTQPPAPSTGQGPQSQGGPWGQFRQGLSQLAQGNNLTGGSCAWQQGGNGQNGSSGSGSSGSGSSSSGSGSGSGSGSTGGTSSGSSSSGSTVAHHHRTSDNSSTGSTASSGQNSNATNLTKAVNQGTGTTASTGNSTHAHRGLEKHTGSTAGSTTATSNAHTKNASAAGTQSTAKTSGTGSSHTSGVASLYRGPSRGSGSTSTTTGSSSHPVGVASIYRGSGHSGGSAGTAASHVTTQQMAMQHMAMHSANMAAMSGYHQMLSSPWSAHATSGVHSMGVTRHR